MKKLITLFVIIAAGIAAFIAMISLYLPLTNPLKKADVIIAVSGGDTQARVRHAVDLYQAGWAPKIIFSGAAKDPESSSNAKVMRSIAAAQGVPPAAIELDEQSRDTKENAAATKPLASKYQTIILVTSEYHQRRVYKEFKRTYDADTEFINSPAKDKNWGRRSWYLTPYGWWISLTEPAKLLI